MASNIQKTIDLIFNGTDNVSNVLGDIEGGIDATAKTAGDLAAPFEAVALSVLALDAALVGLIATGLKVSSDIENSATKMKNALGLPTEEAERFEKIAKDVYSAGYGEDLAASFDAVTLAQQKFGDSAETDIEKAVIAASKLEKTFGVDYSASLSSAKTLMTNFGLSSEEAFDFIAKGMQEGLDGSGDFLESINEYSTQFANGGADAGQFFSVMSSGFQEGMLGTDRAADAFKEFRVRIEDGSATTAEALEQIGLGEEFTESLARGEISAIDAFGTVIERLNATDNSAIQMQAGVGLIGTQFEDLGTKAALALNTTEKDIDDLKDTMSNFDSETFTKNLTSAWRTAIVAVGDMAVWDDLKDKLGDIAGDIAINFADVMANIDTSDIEAGAKEIFDIFAKFFEDANLDLTTAEGMENALKIVTESIESLLDVSKGMAEIAVPAFEAVLSVIEAFNGLSPGTKELVGNLTAMGTALGVVAGALAIGGPFLGGLSTLTGMVTTGGSLISGLGSVALALSGPVGLAAALGIAGAAIVDFSFDQIEKEGETAIKAIEAQGLAVKELTDQIKDLPTDVSTVEIFAAIETGDLEAAQDLIDEIVTTEYIAELGVEADQEELDRYLDALGNIPPEKQTEFLALLDTGSAEDIDAFFEEIASEKSVEIKATPDLESAKQATEQISVTVYDELGKAQEVMIEVPVEATGVEAVKKDIEDIPTEKQIEIKLQGDIDVQIAQITATAETAQAAFKYKAEVDIAEAQEMTKQLEATFESINTSIESSAAVYESAFGGAESSSYQARNEAIEILQQEQELREQSFALQKELTEAQIAYAAAQTSALNADGAVISIDSTGLEPALEMVMWEIIKKVQIRANESAADMLLT